MTRMTGSGDDEECAVSTGVVPAGDYGEFADDEDC